MGAEATLSLCLIVRDEEAMLPGLLEACAGLWDELVAVDTGSQDGTVALLEAAGARVLHQGWADDFAAARNVGLEAATGDWVLVLDADERPSPGFGTQLRAAMADPGIGAATVLMRNHLAHGHSRDVPLLRAFRREGVRYEHRIHEDASRSVEAMLREAGLSAASLTEPVEHLGYVRERAAERDKKERDQRLLRACVEEDPADLYSWFKLLELGRFWQDPAFSASVAEALAPRLAEHAEGLAELPQGAELVTLFAEARHPGDPAAALAESEAFPQAAPSPASLLALGGWLEALSRRDEARRAFERCLQGGDLSTRVSLARPLLGLARLALAEGDAAEAIRRSDQALGHAPRDPEALLGALSLRDDRDRAAFADAHRARHGDSDELAEAEGEAALLGGNALGAIAAYRRSGSPRAALKLAQALVLAGEGDRAREVLAASALPEAGVGLLVCDILDRKASKLEVDLTQNEADVALLDWLRCLQRRPDLLASFLEAAPALLGVFPWLTQLL